MIGRIFLGRYQATKLLGEGGMGRVYLARQLDLGRQVVVKVMHDHVAADEKFRERFQRETLLMARFQHPYAVTLYDASLDDPQGPCIIMEYIRGVTLDALLARNGRLGPARVGRLLGQFCEVLQAAHAEGIIHRDLKPSNLMVVDHDTPYEKVKVMDFGLATLLDPNTLKKVTDTNTEFAVGTPGYMCPEQVRGEEMGPQGDLYSIGVILYELLSGKQPFAGRASMDVLLAHANEEPPSFLESGAGEWVSAAIESVVRTCLAKDPNDRYASARELAEAYELALDEGPAPQLQEEAAQTDTSEVQALPNRIFDPHQVIHTLEAWMPETIAVYKLRGFVQDVGGEVVESVPGRVRFRLGGPGSVYLPKGKGALSWLGIGRRPGQVEVDLYMDRTDTTRESMVQITVAMRPQRGDSITDASWRARCDQIFCDLRGYLMGQTGPVEPGAVTR